MRLLGDAKEGKVVGCAELEREVFGGEGNGKVEGGSIEEDVGMEEEDDDEDDEGGGGVPLPPSLSHPTSISTSNSSTKTATASLNNGSTVKPLLTSQQRGLFKAREREMVRQAARRGVAFGFEVEVGVEGEDNVERRKMEGRKREDGNKGGKEGEGKKVEGKVVRRKVECVQGGRVVESSFARGEWGVRWRV